MDALCFEAGYPQLSRISKVVLVCMRYQVFLPTFYTQRWYSSSVISKSMGAAMRAISAPTLGQGKAAQTFILCSSPPNWARLCDLGAFSRALTARLSTLPHRFTFGFPALCRTG